MHLPRLLVVASALCMVVAPLRASAPDLADALNGTLHVTALVNLAPFLERFPELSSEGFIAEQLDELAARGVPDPRHELSTLALGTQLGKPNGVTEGVALGTTAFSLVPIVRALAEREGIPLEESAYRGVVSVTGTYNQKTSRFADPTAEISSIAYDQADAYQAASRCVDTLQGRSPSYREEFGESLSPGTFMLAQMVLDSATRAALDGTPLENLAHMVSASADLRWVSGRVKMKLRARATSRIKAMFAQGLLRDKLEELASESPDPAVRRLLLEQTTLGRSGSTLKMDTDSPRDDFVRGILALEELLRGRRQAR